MRPARASHVKPVVLVLEFWLFFQRQRLFFNNQFETMQRLGLSLVRLRCSSFGHREVFEPGGADRLDTYFTGGTRVLDAFPTQAMVDRRDHPCGTNTVINCTFQMTCRFCDLISGVMHLTWPSMTRVYDSDRSKDAVTFKPRYNSRNQYSLRNIRKDKVPHFQYVCGWYQEGDQPFSQEFNHSCLKLWEDFLDRLEHCFDV